MAGCGAALEGIFQRVDDEEKWTTGIHDPQPSTTNRKVTVRLVVEEPRGEAVIAYMPVLKAKPGELEALSHLATPLTELRPVLEIVPPGGPADSDDEGPVGKGKENATSLHEKLNRRLGKIATLICDELPPGLAPVIDTSYVDDLPYAGDLWTTLIVRLTARLEPTPVRPVFRLTDSPAKLARLADIFRELGDGGCLRLGTPNADPDPKAAASAVRDLLAEVGLDVGEVDLLIDMWEIKSERDVSRMHGIAAEVLEWTDQAPWRSVTIASGSFPASLQGLPSDGVSALPRLDARLWKEVRDGRSARMPDYGDYAIAHPALSTAGWPSIPNLRYTTAHEWQVYRKKLPLDAGNERFCLICRQVVNSEHFPPANREWCWGDRQIALRADDWTEPGNASKWRAFGTSRHLAVVIDRLASQGEP